MLLETSALLQDKFNRKLNLAEYGITNYDTTNKWEQRRDGYSYLTISGAWISMHGSAGRLAKVNRLGLTNGKTGQPFTIAKTNAKWIVFYLLAVTLAYGIYLFANTPLMWIFIIIAVMGVAPAFIRRLVGTDDLLKEKGGHGGTKSPQVGGNREAIFSRFHYLPDYYSFRPVYQSAQSDDPITIEGRPYRRFAQPDGSWFYPVYLPVGRSSITGL